MRPADCARRRSTFGRRGIAALEFVLVTPVFMFIALATADLVRLFRAQIRLEMIAVQIGQIVSQCTAITQTGDTDQFWTHAERIADGLVNVNSPTGGAMIITAISSNTNNTANVLRWRVRTGNVANLGTFGNTAVNGNPTIRGAGSASFIVPAGQMLFVTEVYANVEPWTLSAGLIGTVVSQQIEGMTMFLSRATEPARLQTAPETSTTRKCTA